MKKLNGFNLLELMVAAAIVGILSAVCFPLYTNHLVHAKRAEAKLTLQKVALNLEQYHLMHDTYKEATIETLGFSDTIANKSYELALLSSDDTDFLIEAKPLGNQGKRDTACGSLLLNAGGEKTITGTEGADKCWG